MMDKLDIYQVRGFKCSNLFHGNIFPFLYLLLIFVSHSLMRTKIHTIIFTLLQKNDPDAVKDQQVFIHKSMLLAIFRNNNIITRPNVFTYIYIYLFSILSLSFINIDTKIVIDVILRLLFRICIIF